MIQYGPDATYGNTLGTFDAGSTPGPQPREVTLTNLGPSSTIHFRVLASNGVQEGVASDDQVFTTDDGVAVDLFEVEGAWEPEVGQERWRRFRHLLRETIEGTISLHRRVDEQRRHYPPPRTDLPVTVAVDKGASDFFTVIEIGAADRIGLLYDITSALADLRLDVHLARVSTYSGRVVDAFYIRDALGMKVTEPAQMGEIEAIVRARLQG